MIYQPPAIGTRIRLVWMVDDPDPILPGQTGTVTQVERVDHRDPWWQIDVAWDNGRGLMLSVPPDQFEILPSAN